jgi:hypothetical protein
MIRGAIRSPDHIESRRSRSNRPTTRTSQSQPGSPIKRFAPPHQQDDYRETPKSPGAFLAHGNAPRRSSRTLGQRNPGFRASHRHPGRFGAEHPATGPQWAKLPDAGNPPGAHAFLITIRGVRTFRAQPLHRDDTYLRRKTMVRLDTRQTGFNLQGRRPPLFYAFHRVIHCENQESMIR